MEDYNDFIRATIKKTTVLEKRFFFVIPFSPLELGVLKDKNFSHDYLISRAKTSLYPKRDHLMRLLAKIGLKGTTLQKQNVVELYYNLYNPSQTGAHLATVDSYTDILHTS